MLKKGDAVLFDSILGSGEFDQRGIVSRPFNGSAHEPQFVVQAESGLTVIRMQCQLKKTEKEAI